MYADSQPTKLYYIIPCYRYEKPQAGRLREFHQFGLEFLGSRQPETDAEAILFVKTFFDKLSNVVTNSIIFSFQIITSMFFQFTSVFISPKPDLSLIIFCSTHLLNVFIVFFGCKTPTPVNFLYVSLISTFVPHPQNPSAIRLIYYYVH